jgi:hypothetical protein
MLKTRVVPSRLYERIGYAYVLRQLLHRSMQADHDYAGRGGTCYIQVDGYLQELVKDAIEHAITGGEFALEGFRVDGLAEEFARAVFRITRIDAQKPPTFRDVVRAKYLAWKRRALSH